MAYPRFLRSRQLVKARRTAGNLTLNNVNWTDVDTGLDLTLDEVQVDDELVFGIRSMWGSEDVAGYLDVATVVSAAPVNSFAEQGAVVTSPGARVWYGSAGTASDTLYMAINGLSAPYTVVVGDLDAGSVTLRLRYGTSSATDKTLFANANNPLDVWAMNLGPAQA